MFHKSQTCLPQRGYEQVNIQLRKILRMEMEVQSKKQLKRKRKLAEYEQRKLVRRAKERERQKAKRREAVEAGLPATTGPSRKALKQRQNEASNDPTAPQIVIDLDYDELMAERDVAKCVKQCLRIYTINRRSSRPCRLHFTGIKTDGHIHAALKKNDGWENWQVKYHFDETHTSTFPKEKLIYLTCESDQVLERLDSECIYVIGGLVDHNHHKGLCHERAQNVGINTARLPLSEQVDMKSRKILSTFHVFEILLRKAEGKTWKDAILETLPIRKGAKPKEESKLIEVSLSKEVTKSKEETKPIEESIPAEVCKPKETKHQEDIKTQEEVTPKKEFNFEENI